MIRGNSDLASASEAALLLGCSVATVYRRANEGSLPGLVEKGGRRWVSVPRLVEELHGPHNLEVRLEEARALLSDARAIRRARRSTETELMDD